MCSSILLSKEGRGFSEVIRRRGWRWRGEYWSSGRMMVTHHADLVDSKLWWSGRDRRSDEGDARHGVHFGEANQQAGQRPLLQVGGKILHRKRFWRIFIAASKSVISSARPCRRGSVPQSTCRSALLATNNSARRVSQFLAHCYALFLCSLDVEI